MMLPEQMEISAQLEVALDQCIDAKEALEFTIRVLEAAKHSYELEKELTKQ